MAEKKVKTGAAVVCFIFSVIAYLFGTFVVYDLLKLEKLTTPVNYTTIFTYAILAVAFTIFIIFGIASGIRYVGHNRTRKPFIIKLFVLIDVLAIMAVFGILFHVCYINFPFFA